MSEVYIAIASSDGINVDLHFGGTDGFYIVSLDESGEYKALGSRQVKCGGSGSQGCSAQSCGASRAHDQEKLLRVFDEIRDCDFVLVSQIGEGAKRLLAKNRISFFEVTGNIDSHLEKLRGYILKTNSIKRINAQF